MGIAFALILDSNPLKGTERRIALTVTQEALARVASIEAARCCQREAWLALRSAAESSRRHLPVALSAEASFSCRQRGRNAECVGKACPLLREAVH